MAGSKSGSGGLDALINKYVPKDQRDDFEAGCADLYVGVMLRRLRDEAGLSVRALAERVGTTPSVISRIEQAEYDGHSLSMLRRVAAALGRRVEVSFPPVEPLEAEKPPALDGKAVITNGSRPRGKKKERAI